MLDLEVVTPPTQNGLDIVSVAEMKKHLRLNSANTVLDDVIESAIIEAAETFHGRTGSLNRTVFPTTWKLWVSRFPRYSDIIELPLPPFLEIESIAYEDGEGGSPSLVLDPNIYISRSDGNTGQIVLIQDEVWPEVARHPRAVAITYSAGYSDYPPMLKRAVKILAAHYVENPEATLSDRVQNFTSKKIEYGLDSLINALRVPLDLTGYLYA